MKCKKCGERASINMRQHRMALCKDHFLEWIPEQTERFIKKYNMFSRDEKILVAVSGGKDSLSLWDILVRLGYNADGLYLGLGIDGGIRYSEESHRLTDEFAKKMAGFTTRLDEMFADGHELEKAIKEQLGRVKYE